MVPWSQLRQPCLGWLLTIWLPNWHFSISNSSKSRVTAGLSVMHLFSRSPAAPAVPVNLTECFSASVKPVRTAETSFSSTQRLKGHMNSNMTQKTRQAHACGVAFLLIVFWWGWTFCASNSLELEQLFMPLRHDLTTVPKGNNARLLG